MKSLLSLIPPQSEPSSAPPPLLAQGDERRPPGPRRPLTLRDDLLEGLALQPVPPPQLGRDVPLPGGEAGGAQPRRHLRGAQGAAAPGRRRGLCPAGGGTGALSPPRLPRPPPHARHGAAAELRQGPSQRRGAPQWRQRLPSPPPSAAPEPPALPSAVQRCGCSVSADPAPPPSPPASSPPPGGQAPC